jgi:hypothetical protein
MGKKFAALCLSFTLIIFSGCASTSPRSTSSQQPAKTGTVEPMNTETSSTVVEKNEEIKEDRKVMYDEVASKYNTESANYSNDLKKIQKLIVDAENVEVYLSCKDLPHEKAERTIMVNGEEEKAYKVTSDSPYKSLDELRNALSIYWSKAMVDKLMESAAFRYVKDQNALYEFSNISDETNDLPIVACTVKVQKANSDLSGIYTLRALRNFTIELGDFNNPVVSKVTVSVINENGSLKLDNLLFSRGELTKDGDCDTDLVGLSEFTRAGDTEFSIATQIEKSLESYVNTLSCDTKYYYGGIMEENNQFKSYAKDLRSKYQKYKLISYSASYINRLADDAHYEVDIKSEIQLTDKNGTISNKTVNKKLVFTHFQELKLIDVSII